MFIGIEFLDHVSKGSVPARFTVYGKVSKVSRVAVCVDCWCYTDKNTTYDSNVDRYTIVRSAITKIHFFKEIK
jgi:hypothetical protein